MTGRFWTAFLLGLAFCAPPGAVTAEALRRGVHRGFAGALLTEIGSLAGDAVWAALALSGMASLTAYRPTWRVLTGLGVLLLFYLAWRALREACIVPMPVPALPVSRAGGDLSAGAALSLSNPQNIAFWLGLGAGVGAPLGPQHLDVLALFFAAFMLACVTWAVFIAAMIAWGRTLLSGPFYRWINLACGVALVYFGMKLLGSLIGYPAPSHVR